MPKSIKVKIKIMKGRDGSHACMVRMCGVETLGKQPLEVQQAADMIKSLGMKSEGKPLEFEGLKTYTYS